MTRNRNHAKLDLREFKCLTRNRSACLGSGSADLVSVSCLYIDSYRVLSESRAASGEREL